MLSFSAATSISWEIPLRILQKMYRCVVQPDVISCSAVISACEKGIKLDAAVGLLQEMLGRLLRPDVISCNASISACEKSIQWQIAPRLLLEMPS